MGVTAARGQRWSWERWALWVTVILAVQVLAIIALSVPSPPPARTRSGLTQFSVVPGPGLAGEWAIEDPTVFALASTQGFSGQAWLRVLPLEHQSNEWTNAPTWLAPALARWGAGWSGLGPGLVGARTGLARRIPPQVTIFPYPAEPVATQSLVRIEGPLAGRGLESPLEVPAISHYELVSNTVVRVTVSAAGFTLSAVPRASSGLVSADQQALELARAARFKALPRAARHQTESGDLIFQWVTVPPGTNAVPKESTL